MTAEQIEQWQQLKYRHQNAIILIRTGQGYTCVHHDASTTAHDLGLTVHEAPNGLYHYTWFPHHALDTYLPKLIRQGHGVAIIDIADITSKFRIHDDK